MKYKIASVALSSMVFTMSFMELHGITSNELQRGLWSETTPFNYPLNLVVYPSRCPDAGVTVCMHGRGANYTTGAVVSQNIDEHVVSFDFPDAKSQSYGTIQELLPPIYVVKKCIESCNLKAINLYGFSAGGGALVNMLAVLNRNDYDAELVAAGITQQDKKAILDAVQNGYVIIDCPLKSMEEIIEGREVSPYYLDLAKTYKQNHLRPIDSLNDLEGLSLTILLNFQVPDEAVTNRDDALFTTRLRRANCTGKTIMILSHDQAHSSYHPDLWKAYKDLK